MARMLADRDSSELHLRLARRHERLARRYRQATLADAVKPLIAALDGKQKIAADKALDREAAYDEVYAADGDLDDGVRNLFNAAEMFDRANPTAPTLPTLFPAGGFGDLIDEPIAQEPSSVEALAAKIEALGSTHALFPQAAALKTRAQAVRTALADLETAVRAEKTAEADEELAQAALRRQYEANYLDGRKAVGRTVAERLFPRANRGSSTSEPTPSGGTTP